MARGTRDTGLRHGLTNEYKESVKVNPDPFIFVGYTTKPMNVFYIR
jgi:hypothetical protein